MPPGAAQESIDFLQGDLPGLFRSYSEKSCAPGIQFRSGGGIFGTFRRKAVKLRRPPQGEFAEKIYVYLGKVPVALP